MSFRGTAEESAPLLSRAIQFLSSKLAGIRLWELPPRQDTAPTPDSDPANQDCRKNEIVAWLSLLSLQERARALTRMCSSLTVSARTLFLPKVIPGNETAIIKYFQALNELHHTLTNQIMAYLSNEELYSLEGLNDMLLEIATKFGIKVSLATAVEWARTRTD